MWPPELFDLGVRQRDRKRQNNYHSDSNIWWRSLLLLYVWDFILRQHWSMSNTYPTSERTSFLRPQH